MKFTFLTKGIVKESTDIISHEKQGSFNLTKWFKKLLSYFNVPFADPCCEPEANRPVRLNNTNNTLESYDSSTNTWVVSTIGGGEGGSYIAGTGMRINSGVINLGLDLSTIATTKDGALTEDLHFVYFDTLGALANTLSVTSQSVTASSTNLFEVTSPTINLNSQYFTVSRSSLIQEIHVTPSETSISFLDSSNQKKFRIDNIGAKYIDGSLNSAGIEYGEDYSTNYTNRSLVDKEYVDSKVGGSLQSITTGAGNNVTNNLLRFTGTNGLVTSQNGAYIGGVENTGMGIFGSFYNGQELGSLIISQAGTELKGGNSLLVINHPGGHYFYDLKAAGGLQYGADYSANYTNRSLVDKGYVDSVVGSTLQSVTTGTGNNITSNAIQLTGQNNVVFEDGLILGYNTSSAQIVALFNDVTDQSLLHLTPSGFTVGVPAGLHLRTDGVTTPFVFENSNVFERVSAANATQPQDLVPLAQVQQMIADNNIEVNTYAQMIASIPSVQQSVTYLVLNDESKEIENTIYKYFKNSNTLMWIAANKEII